MITYATIKTAQTLLANVPSQPFKTEASTVVSLFWSLPSNRFDWMKNGAGA